MGLEDSTTPYFETGNTPEARCPENVDLSNRLEARTNASQQSRFLSLRDRATTKERLHPQGGSENERGLSVASQFVGDHCRDDLFVMRPLELQVLPVLLDRFVEQVAEVKVATMFGVQS